MASSVNSLIDSLPTEIWEHIFYFACSDNGSTGRALSLVSRNILQIVNPHKLRSISVVGGPQIIKFSEFLSTSAASYSGVSMIHCCHNSPPPQTTIQNLFIGITNPRLFPPLTTSSDLLLRSALNSLSLLNDDDDSGLLLSPPTMIPVTFGRGSKDGDRFFIVKAVHRILRLVAPTLHTLHFHITPDTLSSTPFLFPMPRLSELTVYGPLLGGGTISESKWLTIFPSLKRFRMGNFQGLPTDFFPRLAISMPQLTHISLFQPLLSPRHVHSLAQLMMSPETYWSGEALKRMIIEVDVKSVLFKENTTSTTNDDDNDHLDGSHRKRMPWLEKLGDCMRQTADTRVRLIESHRSWVDVETAEMEWSKRNMGTRWTTSFQARHSIIRSSGISFEE